MLHTKIDKLFKILLGENLMKIYKGLLIIFMSLTLLAGCASDNGDNEDSPQPNETVGQGGGMKSGGGNGG